MLAKANTCLLDGCAGFQRKIQSTADRVMKDGLSSEDVFFERALQD